MTLTVLNVLRQCRLRFQGSVTWRWERRVPTKHRKPLARQRSVACQTTRTLRSVVFGRDCHIATFRTPVICCFADSLLSRSACWRAYDLHYQEKGRGSL